MINSIPKPGKRKKGNKNCTLYWDRKAGAAWGEWMHLTKRFCLVCGKGKDRVVLEAHHRITKSNQLTRHDPDNGDMLCCCHHRESKLCSPHAGPLGYTLFLKANYPDKALYVKNNRYRTGKPNFKEDFKLLQSMIDDFEQTSN